MTIAYRPATDDDRHFVVSSWTQSYRTAFTAGLIQDADWYEIMDAQVDKVLRRPDVRTIVACDPDATDRIADVHGFITADTEEKPPLVYYVFCKAPYRKMGIARGLFAAMGINPALPFHYVCSTPMVRWLQQKTPLATWKPLYGRFPKHERRQGR